MSDRPETLKWLIRGVVALTALFVLLSLGLGFLLTTRGGQAFLAARVLEEINGGDVTVAIGSTAGTWPRHIVLTDVVLRDRQGPWLSLDRLELDLRMAALLRGQVHATRLAVNAATVSRLPVGPPQTMPARPFDPTGLLRTLRSLRLDRVEIAALALDQAVIGRPLDVQLTGSLGPSGDGVKLESIIAERNGSGRLTVEATGDSRALAAKLSGALANLSAAVDGTVTINGGAIAGTAHLTCAAPCRANGDPVVDQATVDLVLSGTVRQPHADATLTGQGLTVGGRPMRTLAAKGTVDVDDDRERTLRVNAAGTFTNLRAFAPEVADVVTETATWSLVGRRTGDTTVVESLRIASGDAEATADATLTPDGFAPAHLAMTVRSAGRLGGFGQDRSTTTANLNFTRALRDGTADGDFRIEMTNLNPPPHLVGVVGRDGTMTAKFTADASGIRITDATLASGNLSIRGQSLWTGPLAQVVHQSSTADLTVTATSPTGVTTPANAALRLDGPIASLRGALEVTIPELRFTADAPAQNITLTASATRNGKELAIDVKGGGRWRDQPVEVTAKARKGETPQLTISDLHFASAAGVIDGGLTVDTNNGLTTGTVKARMSDVSVIAAVAGVGLQGASNIDATFAAPGGKQKIDIDAGLRQLKHEIFTADGLTLTASVEDAYGDPQVRARVDSGGGVLLDRPIKSLAITANGPVSNAAVTLELTGAARSPLDISLAGRVGLGDTTKIALSRLRVQDGTLTAQLQGETELAANVDQLTLSPTRIAIAGGLVTAELRANRQDDTAAGTITFDNIELKNFADQAPTVSAPSNTVFSGRVTFSGPASATMADATVIASFDTGRGQNRGGIEITGTARNGRATFTGSASGFSAEPAKLSADLPLTIDLVALKARVDMEGPFKAAINWQGDIGRLWPLVPLDEHVLSGPVAIDVSASGTLAAPVVQGGLRMTGGRYENVAQSTVLEQVNAALTAGSNNSLTFTVSAKDRKNGTLTGRGLVSADAASGWNADITTEFSNLLAFNRDDITATVTGDLAYKGPLDHGTLSGTFNVQSGEIRIDQVYTTRVPLLRPLEDSKREGGDGRTNLPPQPVLPVILRLDVNMDRPIRINGRGLDSWWTGRLTVGGTTRAPDFTGQATVDRGSFNFIGQTFTLDPSSKVTLTGGGEIDPELSILATRQVTDILARANITGRASSPSIELTANPALPQDEVLARLLFQKQTSQLGPLESVQLASAASELAGLSRGGVGGLLQRTLGIDTVGIGGTSGNALVLGQQLGRNLYVSIEQNLSGTGRQVVLEYRFKKGFSLRSATGETGSGATTDTGANIGLSWRKDY